MTNPYITEQQTWQAHEAHSQKLHQACQNAYKTDTIAYEQMRLAQLHHLAQSCVDLEEKWK